MPTTIQNSASADAGDFRFLWLTDLLNRPVRVVGSDRRLGRLTDVVFSVRETYPEAVGLYLEHGWGKPTTFVPWSGVQSLGDGAIYVKPAQPLGDHPPFVDQPGWILGEKHLLGQTILDIDGRRVEAVNDVHLVESRMRLAIVHVDTSLNGFLRRWGLGRLLRLGEDRLISWRYVQPLSVEDVSTSKLALSVTRQQIQDLPGEDLADALEELSGLDQQALFAALEPAKAAEALVATEPRAQRQIVARLPKEKAAEILAQLSVPQIADLLDVLPQDQVRALTALLPEEEALRVEAIFGHRNVTAGALATAEFVSASKDRLAGAMLSELRRSRRPRNAISYVFVTDATKSLVGVVDLRDLVLAPEDAPLSSIMISPAIAAKPSELREDVGAVLQKYHFRMLPVVDEKDRVLGVIRYKDIVRGPEGDARA